MSLDYIECKGAEAMSRWQDLRNQFQTTGKYPFLVGGEQDLTLQTEAAEDDSREPAQIIKQSLQMDAQTWLNERREMLEAEFDEDGLARNLIIGQWPDKFPQQKGITINRKTITGVFKPLFYIGLAEVEQPWMLPAIVKYGGWNECPDAAIHCALMKYWVDQYGIEIVTIAGSIIECMVGNPPTTRDKAMALAWEQYLYCNDIVDQGTETISRLAASLINAKYWFFWWD
jgi:hypothetical protein